jgi:U3 small nucleolar RNA-associated protein 10
VVLQSKGFSSSTVSESNCFSGLEHLTSIDERFARYSNTLFRETSLEVNREQLTPKENDNLNKSISTYLRLLAGYLHLPSALKTLEYLIRRYLYELSSATFDDASYELYLIVLFLVETFM